MKVKLDMIIEYEDEDGDALPDSHFQHVHELLCGAAEHLYDNGLLSNGSEVYVRSCTHNVTLLEEE